MFSQLHICVRIVLLWSESTKKHVVHFDHIFATTMWLVSKPTYFMINNMLVLHINVVATTRKVEPNYSHRYDYNLRLRWFPLKMYMKSEQCHLVLIVSINMDDNVIVFRTTMNVFATAIVYFTTCTKKHKPHMANFVISIGLLSLQCTYPWVFFAIIHGSSII